MFIDLELHVKNMIENIYTEAICQQLINNVGIEELNVTF